VQFDPEKWLIAKADKVLPVHEILDPEQIQIIPEYGLKRIRVILPDFTGKEIFRIFDLTGRTILIRTIQSKDFRINLQQIKTGIYLVQVETKDQIRTEKIRINLN
jgi:hypothetical protein